MEAIAYGPVSSVFPIIPKFLIVKEGSLYHRLLPMGEPGEEVSLISLVDQDQAIKLQNSIPLDRGMWLVVEDHQTVTTIMNGEIELWKEKRSKLLLHRAQDMSQTPEQRIESIRSAAGIYDFDIEEFARRLSETKKSPNESLDEIFRRLIQAKRSG